MDLTSSQPHGVTLGQVFHDKYGSNLSFFLKCAVSMKVVEL